MAEKKDAVRPFSDEKLGFTEKERTKNRRTFRGLAPSKSSAWGVKGTLRDRKNRNRRQGYYTMFFSLLQGGKVGKLLCRWQHLTKSVDKGIT